jgi:hypothetical protein
MRTLETVVELVAFDRRGAGTDAERRAAKWLEGELTVNDHRDVQIEPFWCRPNWALAHAWHALLGVGGSLAAVGSPWLGVALILIALLSSLSDWLFGISLGRRLTPERASQNVVATPRRGRTAAAATPPGERDPVRLIITANYDAPRTGVAYWGAPRRAAARVRTLTRGLTPGWLGWLTIALIWLEAAAILRVTGAKGTVIGAVQLPPTVGLVVGLALLFDIASADFGPGAGDNASGVAVALALARALDAAPPRRIAIELVLTGAGDGDRAGGAIGLRRYLRARRRELTPTNTIVLGVGPSGRGSPRWWSSDGSLIPLAYFRKLSELATTVASGEPSLEARSHRGRGTTPAFPARLARLPAITIGCLDDLGLAPGSHQRSDTPETVDDQALDSAVELGLLLVDAIDAFLGRSAPATAGAGARVTQA